MLILTPRVNMMLRYAAEFNPGLEVAGFGRTEIGEDGSTIIVSDIYIPPQEVKAAHADIKGPGEEGGDGMLEAALQHFATHCRFCGGEQGERHNGHDFAGTAWTDWRLWWHSHGKIAASPSGTDDNSLKMLAKWLDGWAVGLVINAAGERHAWAAVRTGPFNLLTQPLDVGYLREHNEELKQRIDLMMAEVKEWKYQAPPTQGRTVAGDAGSKAGQHRAPNGKRIIDMAKEEFHDWLYSEVLT